MIKTESSAKHYNPHDPTAHLPTSTDDAVGIIRAISVKARSSSQRKEKFRQIIVKLNTKLAAANTKALANGLPEAQLIAVKELLLDMTVRWSSTFHMNHRAYELRLAVDAFTRYLIKSETNAAKVETLKTLRMSEEKWVHVGTFCKLLQLADDAQQEFSSSRYPSLQLALPTIERLHLNYSSRLKRAQYTKFKPAIQKAMEVLEIYNERTSDSHAYTMMMVLDPSIKFSWFRDHWSLDEYDDAVVSVKAIFKKRYIRMYGSETHVAASTQKSKMSRKLSCLINVSDDEDVAGPTVDHITGWEAAYNAYAQVHDEVLPSDGLVVTYWGANKLRLPVWASLAADYLAVMASSVSSERVFSQAGLVITKRRTLLKADIVEAIQMVKYRLKEDTCLELYDAVPSLCVEETLTRIEEEDQQVMEELEVPADLCLELDDAHESGDELSDPDPSLQSPTRPEPAQHYTYPIVKGQLINVALFYTDKTGVDTSYTGSDIGDATTEEMIEMYQGWEPQVEALIKCMPNPSRHWVLLTQRPLETWADEGVMLLGDAAHAMAPNLGTGASQAIEDGYILAQILAHAQAQGPLEILSPDTMALYNHLRPPIANFVQARAKLQNQLVTFDEEGANMLLVEADVSLAEAESRSPMHADADRLTKLGNGILDGLHWYKHRIVRETDAAVKKALAAQ